MTTKVADQFLAKQIRHYHQDRSSIDRIASPGSDYILQLLKGGYLQDYTNPRGQKALDVGCGRGFNMVSLAMLGWEVFGCDIAENIVNIAKENVKRYGQEAQIVVGENQDIPYPLDFFHLLLSINVIHYTNSKDSVEKTIREYARVLKTGGRILLMTNHPENWIFKNGEKIDHNLIQVNRPDDFRHEEVLFCFADKEDLEHKFSPYFHQLMIGENRMEYFKKEMRHFVLTGIKK
jgi:SAM-dependent methyltransferase